MTSEPRVNCQRGGKGLVRVGLSDKGVGTPTLSLSLSPLFHPRSSFSPLQRLFSRVTARARSLFFSSPLFAFLISFSSDVASARFAARVSRNNGLPHGELNRERIKSSSRAAPRPVATPRLRERSSERRISDETLIGISVFTSNYTSLFSSRSCIVKRAPVRAFIKALSDTLLPLRNISIDSIFTGNPCTHTHVRALHTHTHNRAFNILQ